MSIAPVPPKVADHVNILLMGGRDCAKTSSRELCLKMKYIKKK